MKINIYIFVKTPERTKVKTRLAKTIGDDQALTFYLRSIQIIKNNLFELKRSFPTVNLFWAVAEDQSQTHPLWQDFKVVEQSSGDLGDRLHSIYQHAQNENAWAVFMGSDSPHLPLSSLKDILVQIFSSGDDEFLVAPAEDGGFYLFASKVQLQLQDWKGIRYSCQDTTKELISNFSKKAQPKILSSFFDVDEFEDLIKFSKYRHPDLNLEQQDLIAWASGLICSLEHQKQRKENQVTEERHQEHKGR